MAELSTEQRHQLKDGQFAYIDKNGDRHLPINDEEHVRDAMSRWSQTDFGSQDAKEKARTKTLDAAKKYGIHVSKDDKIVQNKS